MRQLQPFLRLPRPEQLLLLKVLLLVVAIRVALSTLRFQTVQRMVERAARLSACEPSSYRLTPERLAWLVRVSAAQVPAASCLTQAMAAQVLLRRYGYACELRIGVACGIAGKLDAHAWIEYEGHILLGGPAAHIARFTPLPTPGHLSSPPD